MIKVRPELIRGIALLAVFVVIIISSDTLFPYAIQQSEYVVVSVEQIKQNPTPFEGRNISSQVTITSIIDEGVYLVISKDYEIILTLSSSFGSVSPGERVYIRGVSWIQTNNSIAVHEIYVLDYNSSLIRSAPGILLFIIIFFSVFKIDIKQIAIVRRKAHNA